jgi:hypothetical protein
MDSGWARETRVCATIGVRSDLLKALRAYIEEHELEGAEADALVCFETTSQRTKKPSMMERMAGAGYKVMTQAIVVTPTRLIWAQTTGKGEAFARSELLARLEVTDYERSPAYSLMPDHGVEVQGIVATEGRVGTVFFGLGEGPDADRARHVFKAAVKAAHGEGPPVVKE